MAMAKSKVLIIGTSNQYSNALSVSWKQLEAAATYPLIGDYETVILYLPTLEENSFSDEYEYYEVSGSIKPMIKDALKGNTSIYCVTAPPVHFGNEDSYSLIPFSVGVDVEHGSNFSLKDVDRFKYLEDVKSWEVAFSSIGSEVSDSAYDLKQTYTMLASGNHTKPVALRIDFETLKRYVGGITFIPPLTKKSEPNERSTITKLLRTVLPESDEQAEVESLLADRAKELLLFGEEKLVEERQQLTAQIDISTTRVSEIDTERVEYVNYKGIIGLQGSALEQSVDKVLNKLGLNFSLTGTNKEDGNVQISENINIPVEVKGHETKGSSERDLRQVISRLRDDSVGQFARGILIVNSYYKISEAERAKKKTFESSVVQQAKAFDIILIDTKILIEYLNDQLEYGNSYFLDAIKQTQGELIYKKFNLPDQAG